MNDNKTRREFLKKSMVMAFAAGSTLVPGSLSPIFANTSKERIPDLVAVKNGEPDIMFNKGIKLMGGMKRFVKKGQTVLVKPNIGFNRTPEFGATTNPLLVKAIIEHGFGAGAKKVYVFDHEASSAYGLAAKCYKNSGIESAAKQAGAIMAPADDYKYYQGVKIPGAKILHTTDVHELLLETDVFINVPVLKHHSYTHVTMAMKNLMGVVWDRMYYHGYGLDQCIAEFCLYKKPDLNVLDAYRVMKSHGPYGNSPEDVVIAKSLLISEDIVAIDTAASLIFGIPPQKVDYIAMGQELKLGKMNLDELNIKRLVL
ncbi:MAG: DUF362 domain-containing protein [Desulfobacteraceae bacterium]|nr:DUF362 domain-containing protein [Desulfobacteraceae bacterium]